MAEELDLGVTAWSPLAQGVLSGKFNSGTPNAATRQQRDQIPPAQSGNSPAGHGTSLKKSGARLLRWHSQR